jgi:hypothetical protein
MATILEFHRPDDAAALFDHPLYGLGGEIIIFPGVKIERPGLSDEPQHTGSTKRRRLARDRKKSRG